MPDSCCAVDCANRRLQKGGKALHFYNIPAANTPFKAERRRLWIKAIRRENWSEKMINNAKLCSAHFISGQKSDDPNHPDFVPSVFRFTKATKSDNTNKQKVARFQRLSKQRESAPVMETSPEQVAVHVLLSGERYTCRSNNPVLESGEPNDDERHPDSQSQSEKLQLFLEQYHRTGKLNDVEYRPDIQPQKKLLQVCLEKAGCEQPQLPQQEKNSSCPPQQERVNFCEDCSSKRVREVKAQLEKLFTEKSWKPNHCGICNRRFLNPSVAILLQKKVPVTKTTEYPKSDKMTDGDDYVYSKKALEDRDFKDNPITPKTSEALQSGEASCETSKKVRMSSVKSGVLQTHASHSQSMSKYDRMDSSGSNKVNASGTDSAYERASENDSSETDSAYERESGNDSSETESADEGDSDSDKINEGPLIKVDTNKTLAIDKDSLNNTDSLWESNQNETLSADTDDISNKVLPYNNKAAPIIDLDLSSAAKGLDARVIAMLDRSARNPFQPFKCKHCTSREYGIAGSFVKHMQETLQEGLAITKPYVCNKCSKQFWLIEQLQAHFVNHKTFDCPYPPCLRTFQTKGALISHKRIHKPEGQTKQPIVCSTCGKHFMSKSKLNFHKAIHSDDRPFVCLQCGKTFKLQRALKAHVRVVHDNDKPFVCEICGTGWICRKNLSVHMRTHSGEKPYSCDACDYRCARKDYLDKHLRIHSGEKPYKCNQCSKAFTQCTSLTLHRKKYHAEAVIKTEQADDFVTVDFSVTNDSVTL